jgi:hypothetical protein
MIRGLTIIAAAGLALAACGRAGGEKDAAHLTIGPKGVMGLSSAIAFDAAAIAPLFEGLDIAGAQAEREGQRFPIFAVRSGDEIVYTIAGGANGRVASVSTRSPLVVGPAGESVGQASFAEAPPREVAVCSDEFFDGQPAFACSDAAGGAFHRVYLKLISDGAPDSAELAEMSPAVKAQSPLVEMRWTPSR